VVPKAYAPAAGNPPANSGGQKVLPAESKKSRDCNYMKQNDKEDRVPVNRLGF
jgi:hypothetical protein